MISRKRDRRLTGTTLADRGVVDYEGDPLALILLTASPHRICPRCLADRTRIEDPVEAHARIALLAEGDRFNVRPDLCVICADEGPTLGVAARSL